MKLLLIPDVHGRASWQQPVKDALKLKDIHIIFLGDYVDSFDIPGFKILQNLREIIALKKKFPDKVTLLLGNHDYAYIHGFYAISGFQASMMNDYRQIFEENKNLFEVAWGSSGKERYTLVTHAGLTEGFYNVLQKKIEDPKDILHLLLVKFADKYESWQQMPLHELLNYFKDKSEIMWYISAYRGSSPSYTSAWKG